MYKNLPRSVRCKNGGKSSKTGKHLSFFPKVFNTGSNYIVMEYFNAQTLKEYLKNCTYIPESIARKLLTILNKLKMAKFPMVDTALRHVLVLENEELKVVDHVYAFKSQPVPLKLLRDLNTILLKDSFLAQVKKLEPETFEAWEKYFNENSFDYKNIPVTSGGSGEAVKVESEVTQTLIGKGHQGAVFRVSEDKCVKIYGKPEHAKQEQKVLISSQNLSFIPKVYETGPNYVLMEYLLGPNLYTFLKKQSKLSEDITRQLLNILTTQKKSGFKQIDAPLRHIIVTNNGFKMVDYVYSFSREQERPLELFQNLHERGFLDAFLEQVKVINPDTHAEWTKTPIQLTNEEIEKTERQDRKRNLDGKKDNKRKKDNNRKKDHDRKKGHDHKRSGRRK